MPVGEWLVKYTAALKQLSWMLLLEPLKLPGGIRDSSRGNYNI